jgi:hypothetical protein
LYNPKKLLSLRSILAGISVLVCCCALVAQNPQLQTKSGRRFPTVVFTSVLWSMNPSYYSIAVDSSGAATYQSAPNSVDSTGVPYTVVFQVSDATRRTTFIVARNLDFFRGEFPVTVGSPQQGPIRTLGFHDATISNQITYSDSTDSEIQELTSVFEEISTTLEFGRRLAYFHDHHESALEAELASMQKEGERHHLRELQAVASVLRSIASDKKVEQAARSRAEALLNPAHASWTTPVPIAGP